MQTAAGKGNRLAARKFIGPGTCSFRCEVCGETVVLLVPNAKTPHDVAERLAGLGSVCFHCDALYALEAPEGGGLYVTPVSLDDLAVLPGGQLAVRVRPLLRACRTRMTIRFRPPR